MKKAWLAAAFLFLSAARVLAGQGTIEETDTAIIVEYTGDGGKDTERQAPAPLSPKTPRPDWAEQPKPEEVAKSGSPVSAEQDAATKRASAREERMNRRRAMRIPEGGDEE